MGTKSKVVSLDTCTNPKCEYYVEHNKERVLCNRAGGRSPGYLPISPSNWNDGVKQGAPSVRCHKEGVCKQ